MRPARRRPAKCSPKSLALQSTRRAERLADLEEAGEVVLAARDQQLFASLLLDPPKANGRLRATLAAAEVLSRRR